MNQSFVFLDTETTGLDPALDSIIEIGCVKVHDINHPEFSEANVYHRYINTDREISQESFQVHGIAKETLQGRPYFSHLTEELLTFIGDSTIIAHNADFDLSFLKSELQRVGICKFNNQVIDSLVVARKLYPGSQVNLDALMKRFGMSTRGLHSALEDAKILARIYACMHLPKQSNLFTNSQDTMKQKFQICQKVIKNCS